MEIKTPKENPESLMEALRQKPPQVRTINEIVNLLHVISTEQRSCSILRSCVDKVLMNSSNIRSLRDIIERLRSVSRTNGLRVEISSTSSPETRCHLISDMFSVEIVLGTSLTPDQCPTVTDVRIQHYRGEPKSCLRLVNILRAGKFLEMSEHLKGLTEMYLTFVNPQMRTRAYMALQSLEADLVKMSQVFRETNKTGSILDVVQHGTVGLLTPRVAGYRSHLSYYISPYDLIDITSKHKLILIDEVPKSIGLHAEVGIEQRNSACSLPISPLIFNKHSVDNSGVARFVEVSQHNSTMVHACFVLHLKPALPILTQVAEKIRKDTNLPLASDNTQMSYLEMLHAHKDTFKIKMENQSYVYHLNVSEMTGTLVKKVYFSHPGHVMKVLKHLRKQAHLNTLLASCVRKNSSSNGITEERQWYFDISCNHELEQVNVIFEHPLCKSTASLEIQLDETGFSRCKIYTGRGDPPLCTDQFVTKIIRQCSSLPIVMKKLINQSIKHPRKESDVSRIRPLFSATTHPVPNRAPTLLTPVHKPPPVQRQPSTPSSALFTPTPSFSPMPMSGNSFDSSGDGGKKIARNPMLTKLLIPSTDASLCQPDAAVQTKNHPMLMGLLKETENEIMNLPQGSNTQSRNLKNPHLSFQLQNVQTNNELNYNHGPSNMLVSPGSNYSMMDSQIPIPTSHQMPPPSYPTHLTQNQFGSAGSLSNLPSPASGAQQYQMFQPSFSAPSPLGTLDDVAGQMNMMSPGLLSPGLQSHGMPSQPRGRRGSRQKSRSIESHQSMDFGQNFEVTTPTFEAQMSVESDSSIAELQNRGAGMPGSISLHRSDSMSPVINVLGHIPLQHSTSLKMMTECSTNNLVTRSASVGSGKNMRSMPSPKTTPFPDSMSGIRGTNRSLDNQNEFSMGRLDFRSANSLTPNEIDTDPFTFDDNKNPSKISMSENTISMLRSGKTSIYQSGSMQSNPSATYTDDSETLRELAMSKPVLLRALTGGNSPVSTKSDISLFQRNFSSTSPNIITTLTSTMPPVNTTTSAFNISSKTHLPPLALDKSLVRQNAVDKQTNVGLQGKLVETKNEKTVKRRNSSKGEDGKAVPKKRGRPPSVKDHGGKRKKNEALSSVTAPQEEPALNTPTGKSITLTVQLSSTGTPISSTTKTKTLNGANGQQQKPPVSIPGLNQTNNLNNANGSTVQIANVIPEGLQNYFRSQEELQSRRMREIKEREKKGPTGSTSTTNKAPSSVKLTAAQTPSSGSGTSGSVVLEKPAGNAAAIKPGSTSPRASGGNILKQVRPRKNSIKDAIDKLYCRMPGTMTTSSITSTSSTAANTIGKDANSNLLLKGKTPPSTVNHLKSTINSNVTKTTSKVSSDDKPAIKTALVPKPINYSKNSLNPKYPADLTTSGKSSTTPSSGTSITSDFPSQQQLVRKDSMNEVLKRIQEAAAASTKQGTPVTAKMPTNKMQRTLPSQPVKARSVTPTSVAATSTQQRKSPSSQIISQAKAISFEVTSAARQSLFKSNSSTPPPIKISSSRSSGMLPLRPSSASSVEAPVSASLQKPVSSSPVYGMFGSNRKLGPGELNFVTPTVSPTPKKTSPQVSRTASPLTRVEDKSALPNKSPHRSSTPRVTPVPEGSPSSPGDRLVIDDPLVQPTPIASVVSASTRDEQCPVFLPGRPSESQSPERTVMASPMSPPSQKSLAQSMRRNSIPRGNITPSVTLTSITAIIDSPPVIDDDLMDQAVID